MKAPTLELGDIFRLHGPALTAALISTRCRSIFGPRTCLGVLACWSFESEETMKTFREDKATALDSAKVGMLPRVAVGVLERVIAVCVDSEERYRHAARDVSRADLESFFNRQAELCKRAADELQVRCKRLGIVEDESGTFGGLIDRTAMDLSVVMSMGDSGVVDWCRKDAARVVGEYKRPWRNLYQAISSVCLRLNSVRSGRPSIAWTRYSKPTADRDSRGDERGHCQQGVVS